MTVMFMVEGKQASQYIANMQRHDAYRPVRDRSFPRPPIAYEIIRQTAHDHGVALDSMYSDVRWRAAAHARFDAMTRLRALIGRDGKPRFSLPHIGWLLGGRDHSTVKNGLTRWAKIQAAKREAEAA